MTSELDQEIRDVATKGDTVSELSPKAYQALFNHYANSGDMPYGVMKARNGDPDEWLDERLPEWADEDLK